MSAHTPGPWVVFGCDGALAVMPAMRPGDICTGINNDADASLIAAAPELLAACKAALATHMLTESEPGLPNLTEVGEMLRTAIAAAEKDA